MTAASRSASGRMMLGDLPPSSSVTRLRSRPHRSAISRPTALEPVNATLSTPGCATSAAPVEPSPVSTLRTPGGSPASRASSPSRSAVERRLLRGLEHDRAAGGQRRPDLPDRHQQREVPGDDLGADADRLASRVTEDPRVARRDGRALDLGRPARVVLEVGDAVGHVDPLGELQRLAVVERLELGQLLLDVACDELGERLDPPAALGGGQLAPRRADLERAPRGRHRRVDVVGAGKRDLRGDGAGRGVVRRERPAVGGRAPLAVDEQAVLAGEERPRRLGEPLVCRGVYGHRSR